MDNLVEKHPTISADVAAYASEGKKTFTSTYTSYIQNVETIDRAIRTIANIMSLCKVRLVKENTKGVRTPTKVKNISTLMANETDSMIDFMRKLSVNIFSQGAGLIVPEDHNGMVHFYPIDVGRISAESNGSELITTFVYTSESSELIRYAAKDCIYINDSIDPSNLLYSLSRLRSLNDVILIQAGIVNRGKDLLNGAAKDSFILSSDTPISKDNMTKIKGEFDKFTNATSATSLFVNMGLDFQQVGSSITAGDLIELLKEVNRVMLDQFNIPPYLLGDYKAGANRNTEITYALRIFFTSQLLPVLKNIEIHWSNYLQTQLGLTNIFIEFDYHDLDILKLPEEEQAEMVLKTLKGGAITLNEARQAMGYPPITSAAADKVFMPAYLLGNAPVSYNGYDADLERLLNLRQNGAVDLPAGNSGGSDNENVETGDRGGNA